MPLVIAIAAFGHYFCLGRSGVLSTSTMLLYEVLISQCTGPCKSLTLDFQTPRQWDRGGCSDLSLAAKDSWYPSS